MSVLQKGVLSVISVTAFASVLILFSGGGTAEAERKFSVNPPAIINQPSKNKVPKLQKSNLKKTPVTPLSPPPIGPFQVAQPNMFKLLKKSDGSFRSSSMLQQKTVVMPFSHNMKPPRAPVIKRMNQYSPQSPKEIRIQKLEPGLPVDKLNAPFKRLTKPRAPVLKVPELFSAPPIAPQMQRNMPTPIDRYPQVPQMPMATTHSLPLSKSLTTPKFPSGAEQNKLK